MHDCSSHADIECGRRNSLQEEDLVESSSESGGSRSSEWSSTGSTSEPEMPTSDAIVNSSRCEKFKQGSLRLEAPVQIEYGTFSRACGHDTRLTDNSPCSIGTVNVGAIAFPVIPLKDADTGVSTSQDHRKVPLSSTTSTIDTNGIRRLRRRSITTKYECPVEGCTAVFSTKQLS